MVKALPYSARRIRAFRKLKGYTQEKLAMELHVSVSVIGSVERGTKQATPELLQEISRVLNIPMNELMQERIPAQEGVRYDES